MKTEIKIKEKIMEYNNLIKKIKLIMETKTSLNHETPPIANVRLAAGICRHAKHQIAEREFYVNQKTPYSGTRIICKKCGANKFIKDAKYGVYACR